MKSIITLLAIALQITGVLCTSADDTAAADAHAALVAECGDLGVMEIPQGADASQYRKCKEHPEGSDRALHDQASSVQWLDSSIVPRSPDARQLKGSEIFRREAQKCEYSAGLGCSRNGYCWKACGAPGDGNWCWTAGGSGSGAWLTCKTYNDCNANAACGWGCAACGCGGCS